MDRDPARALTVLAVVFWILAVWAPRNRGLFGGFALAVTLAAMLVQWRVVRDEIRTRARGRRGRGRRVKLKVQARVKRKPSTKKRRQG